MRDGGTGKREARKGSRSRADGASKTTHRPAALLRCVKMGPGVLSWPCGARVIPGRLTLSPFLAGGQEIPCGARMAGPHTLPCAGVSPSTADG